MTIPGNWRTRQQRYGLKAEHCEACGKVIYPPRDTCPDCGRQHQTWVNLSGRGEVYSYTIMHHAPANFEEFVPYPVALIKLEEGPMVTAQLTDISPDEVRIGMPVEMVTRKLSQEGDEGQIVYGYKFRPLLLPR